MKVLLSINPEHAEKIFSGEKRFEFRKNAFREPGVSAVVLYVTKPVARILGEFQLLDICTGSPEVVWEETRYAAGISKAFFLEYFSDRKNAYALRIGEVIKYDEPIDPKAISSDFVPPQSFRYLENGVASLAGTVSQPDLFEAHA